MRLSQAGDLSCDICHEALEDDEFYCLKSEFDIGPYLCFTCVKDYAGMKRMSVVPRLCDA